MANFNFKKIANFFAYVAIIFVAIALVVGRFWKDVQVLEEIAAVIAYAITSISAFFYAKSKSSVWFMIIFIIAVVLIFVFLILKVA